MRGRSNSSFTMSMQPIRRSAANLYDRESQSILRCSSSPTGDSTKKRWWSQTESNRRHPACKAGALPTELWPHCVTNAGNKPGELSATVAHPSLSPLRLRDERLVGLGRLELPTLRLSGVRSNHLSYRPMAARQPGLRPGLAIASPSTRPNAQASVTK